ncbi:MAG: beta-lactamase family protein [Bacteroidales bacterium]|nr:beta-lactamase family protein [Bacteroidales bacterium]
MKLYEEGRIDLNSKVFGPEGILNDSAYLIYSDNRIEDIEIVHLLNHTAGWSEKAGDPVFNSLYIARKLGITPPARLNHIIYYQLQEKLKAKPGTKYSYSNFGMLCLGW